jgi:hypothetical protein
MALLIMQFLQPLSICCLSPISRCLLRRPVVKCCEPKFNDRDQVSHMYETTGKYLF